MIARRPDGVPSLDGGKVLGYFSLTTLWDERWLFLEPRRGHPGDFTRETWHGPRQNNGDVARIGGHPSHAQPSYAWIDLDSGDGSLKTSTGLRVVAGEGLSDTWIVRASVMDLFGRLDNGTTIGARVPQPSASGRRETEAEDSLREPMFYRPLFTLQEALMRSK